MSVCDETKPYVFISYSHRDTSRVYKIIERMQAEGFNVWYDEGIDPGTEWDENIAKHVIECSYFIAFISNGYLGSKNCKDELNYSRDLDKEQLLVYLEDVDLPSGMAMRMNRIQAIYWNRYDEGNVEEAYQKLFAANGISKARFVTSDSEAQPSEAVDAAPAEENVANESPEPAATSPEPVAPNPSPAPASPAPANPAPVNNVASPANNGNGNKEKKKFPVWIIIVIVVAVLAIGGVIAFLVLGDDSSSSSSQRAERNTSSSRSSHDDDDDDDDDSSSSSSHSSNSSDDSSSNSSSSSSSTTDNSSSSTASSSTSSKLEAYGSWDSLAVNNTDGGGSWCESPDGSQWYYSPSGLKSWGGSLSGTVYSTTGIVGHINDVGDYVIFAVDDGNVKMINKTTGDVSTVSQFSGISDIRRLIANEYGAFYLLRHDAYDYDTFDMYYIDWGTATSTKLCTIGYDENVAIANGYIYYTLEDQCTIERRSLSDLKTSEKVGTYSDYKFSYMRGDGKYIYLSGTYSGSGTAKQAVVKISVSDFSLDYFTLTLDDGYSISGLNVYNGTIYYTINNWSTYSTKSYYTSWEDDKVHMLYDSSDQGVCFWSTGVAKKNNDLMFYGCTKDGLCIALGQQDGSGTPNYVFGEW